MAWKYVEGCGWWKWWCDDRKLTVRGEAFYLLVETGVASTGWREFNQEENEKKEVEEYLMCWSKMIVLVSFPRTENDL